MSARSPRRWIALLAVVAVFAAAACSTSSKGSSSGGNGGTSSAAASATATGVTADAIRIGFSYPDLAALAKTGIIKTDNGPYEQIVKALVDDINTHGGINGRKLELFSTKYDVLTSTAQTTGCTQLTEDNKVFAVLGGFIGDNNLCVTQQHGTILVSGYGSGFNQIALSKARAPWVTWNAGDERASKALVQLLAQQGKLQGKTIAVEGQVPGSKPLVDLVVKALQDAGYKVADTGVIDAPASDSQAYNSADKILAQRFRDKRVDAFFLLGGTPTASNYDAVGWHPEIYVPQTALVTPGAYTSPFQKFPFIAGVDASADQDAGYNTPEMQHCRAVYKQATGIDILTTKQETANGKTSGNPAMTSTCTALQIFVAAAKAAGKNLNQQTWQKGLESIGKIALPSAAVASFGPNKPDGQDTFQLEKHDPAWKPNGGVPEFVPMGAPIALTS